MKHFSSLFRSGIVAGFVALLAGTGAHAQTWQTAVAPIGGEAEITALTTGASGDIYLTGTFEGTITVGATSLTSLGSLDVFVAKWRPATSRFVWAQRAGGDFVDYATGVAVSGSNVYITGSLGSQRADFGATTVNSVPGSSFGDYSSYVAKLTDAGATGSFVWATGFGGPADDEAKALAVSGSTIYVGGVFAGTASFGSTSLTSTGDVDGYVAKLTDGGASGAFAWAQRMGGTAGDELRDLAVSGGNVYATGYFESLSATFGATTLANATQTSPGTPPDVFVTKLVDAGASSAFAWAQRGGGTGFDVPAGLAVNGNNVYVVGEFGFGNATFGTTPLVATGLTNVFVAKLSDAGTSGTFVWAQKAGGTRVDYASDIAVSGSNVYITGDFGNLTSTFGTTALTSAGQSDVYVAKLIDAGATGSFAWAQRAGGTTSEEAHALTVNGPTVYVAGYASSTPAGFGTVSLPGNSNFLASITDNSALASRTPSGLAAAAVHPNPAHGTATVQLPAVAGTALATLRLTDALGREVRSCSAALLPSGSAHALDLAGLPAGVYQLHVQAGANTRVFRLSVE